MVALAGRWRKAGGVRVDRTGGWIRRRQCPNDRYSERRRLALRFEWRETLHHQCSSVAGLDGDGANAGSEQAGQRRDYRFFGHAGHPRCGNDRRSNAKARDSRHCHGALPFKQCACAERKYSRPARQRFARRADRSGFRAHHFRSLLHRRGQTLPAAGDRTRQFASAIQKNPGQFRSGKKENRAHGGRRLRDGSNDQCNRIADRSRSRGLHD